MNNALYNFATTRRLLGALLVAQLALTTPLHAASVALATAPLANSTTTTVLPNLMSVSYTHLDLHKRQEDGGW